MVLGKQNLSHSVGLIEKPWWNRPLIGQRSLVERTRDWLQKKSIPEETLALYDKNYTEMQQTARRLQTIDSEKFGNEEFLSFVKIQFALRRGEWGYLGFEQSIELLKVGVKARKAFLGLETVEFGFQGSRFGEMYDFVSTLCAQKVGAEVFKRQIRGKFAETKAKIRSEEGQQALQLYAKHLEDVSEHPLSLKLLYAFRQYKMQNYAIFKTISDLITALKRDDLLKVDALKLKVIENFEVFESLGRVIEVPETQRTPKTYTQILQYLALSEKHAIAFLQFSQIVDLFVGWKRNRIILDTIRQEYPANKYKIPKNFRQSLPGTGLYQKYQTYFEE